MQLKDIWMSVLTFVLLATTIGIGIWRLIADGIVRSTWNFGWVCCLNSTLDVLIVGCRADQPYHRQFVNRREL